MKSLIFTILTTLLITVSVFAKKSTFDGYIITKNGERVFGKVKTRNVTTDQMKITFIQGKVKTTFKARELSGYGYEHIGENQFGEDVLTWRHYKTKTAQSFAPKAFASKTVFMEIMEQGTVTLYDYYVETPRDIENPYKRFFYLERESDNELIEVSKDNYEDLAAMYFEDNYELAEKVGTINHRFRHLYKVVKIYNDWNEMQTHSHAADYDETQSTIIPF